jgi:hypothetical protein
LRVGFFIGSELAAGFLLDMGLFIP